MSLCQSSVVRCHLFGRPRFRTLCCVRQWHQDAVVQPTRRCNHSISESASANLYGSEYCDGNSGPSIIVCRDVDGTSVQAGDSASRRVFDHRGDVSEMGNSRLPISKTAQSIFEPINQSDSCSNSGGNITPTVQRNGKSVEDQERARRRVIHTINSAQNLLKHQGRVIGVEAFRHEVVTRLNSMYPYTPVHKYWNSAYTTLYTAKFHNKEWKPPKLWELDQQGIDLIQILETDSLEAFKDAWKRIGPGKHLSYWPRLALHLLWNSPKLAIEFLLATTIEPYPPFVMLMDCIVYLYTFHYGKSDDEQYRSAISICLDPERWPSISLSQRGIRTYLMLSKYDDVSRAFKLIREREIQISAETALCFVTRFTDFRDVDKAIEALSLLPWLNQPGFTLDTPVVLIHCSKLLMLDTVQEQEGVRNFKILPELLKLGVRPNREMMNIVLANAFKTGDPQLGEDMLAYMKDRGFEFDSYTYLTLLTDAVARGDCERLDTLLQEISPMKDLKDNPYIASKIFHAHFTFSAKYIYSDMDPTESFSSNLGMYSRFYDLTPLKELLIIPHSYTAPGHSANSKPSTVALYVMLATYLRCNRNAEGAYRVYCRFRHLVMQGHETIAPLAETDHSYNEFICTFRHDPNALPYCIQVVEDMLLSVSKPASITGSKSRTLAHTKPTSRTWTILLSAFVFNRQLTGAEKVKKMMKKHGVEYNMVTWNTIINGYVNAQMVADAAESIKRMEGHGFSIDAYTLKCLRYLKDPESLKVAIEDLDRRGAKQDEPSEPDKDGENERLLEEGLRRLAAKSKTKSRNTH